MKRALHLITSLQGGGTENFLWQILTHSPSNWTHEVIFLKSDGVMGERIRRAGIPVQHLDNPLRLFFYLRRSRPDVLHTLLYRASQMGRVMGRAAGIPCILSSQRAIDRWQRPWHRALDALTLRLCDGVIANSRAAGRLIEERLPRMRDRLFILPNATDSWNGPPIDKMSARQSLRLPIGARIAGAVLRLHHEKGADRIPAFAARALKQHPDLHLAIAGEGPLGASLRRALERTPGADRIHWLGWVEEIGRYHRALDLVWSLSREESFPQSLVEASAAGLPWIAPRVGGIPELLEAGAAGLTFTAATEAELIEEASSALDSILENLDDWTRRSQVAAAGVSPSVTEMVDRFYFFLQDQLNRACIRDASFAK